MRKHFFGKYPELLEMVANMSDDDIWRLNRGGHDPHKIYAAYAAAVKHKGQPTVILAKTIKGYGMGEAGEGQNITHQQKKMGTTSIRAFRDRFNIPIPDDKLEEVPFFKPAEDSAEMQYLQRAREGAGRFAARAPAQGRAAGGAGACPRSRRCSRAAKTARCRPRWRSCASSTSSLRDKKIGKYVVPIVPDESRTFGMEGMFRQLGIYSSVGQLYKPQDADQLMYYKEDKNGQILQEGINEAGGLCSWIAAGTAYSTHGISMIPFYIFYSMFGFQRVGDLDLGGWRQPRARLPARRHRRAHHAERRRPAARGRPQPPAVVDRAELHFLRSDLRLRTRGDHPGRHAPHVQGAGGRLLLHHRDERELRAPGDAGRAPRRAFSRACTCCPKATADKKAPRVQLLGSGTILREVIAAAELLKNDFGVVADVWSCPSFNELRREGLEVERWNLLHPEASRSASPTSSSCLEGAGPGDRRHRLHEVVRRPDPSVRQAQLPRARHRWLRALAISASSCASSSKWTATTWRSRRSRRWPTKAPLPAATVAQAIKKYGIDPDKPYPPSV